MTSPLPLPPHHDPTPQPEGGAQVTIMEHITTLVSTLDRRFDTLHQDLKDSIGQRFHDTDLRYQQRFDAQTKALDAALAAQKEAVTTALIAAEKAVNKAESAAEKRFENVNEFRGQLSDQASTFFPRAEAESRMSSLAEKIDDLKESRASTSGHDAGANIDHRLQELTAQVAGISTRLSTGDGKSAGLNAGWVYLLAALGAFGTIISLYLALQK